MSYPPGPPSPSGQFPPGAMGGMPPGPPHGVPPGRTMLPPPMFPPIGADGRPVVPGRGPDPGSRTGALLAKLVLIPLILLVAALQQAQIYMEQPEDLTKPPVEAPTMGDQGLLVTRLFLKCAHAFEALKGQGEPLNSMDALWEGATETPAEPKERPWRVAMQARIDQLRAAIVAGETLGEDGPRQAVERLDALRARLISDANEFEVLAGDGLGAAAAAQWGRIESRDELPRELRDESEVEAREVLRRSAPVVGTLIGDAGSLRRHYAALASGEASPLDADEWTRLEEHHGWFAELAQIAGTAENDPARESLLRGGGALLTLFAAIGVILTLAAIGALSSGIWLIVMLSMGEIRFWFVPPVPGGSVYLETVALLVVAFLGTQIIGGIIAASMASQEHAISIAIGMQWLVLLVIFWPLVRGVSVSRWRRDLGLIAPRGVARELGAGLIGYLAGLPLVLIFGLIGVGLKTIQDNLLGDRLPYTTGGNPVLEMVTTGGVLQLVLFLSVATIWAPLVEEIVFRGCLYRHLRGRVGFLVAGPLSALAFGIMHGYEFVLLGPVIALGATFAFIREWRGSLLGAIVMHALHNGTLLAIVVTLVRVG